MAMYQNPIKINLMPHREALKETRKKAFIARIILVAVLATLLVFFAWQLINQYIAVQTERNNFIISEIKKLDAEIAQIATLQAEIDALKARQKAVEDLQADRNIPVYVLEELVNFTPEGVYLKNIKQDSSSKRITITGVAQTQERISEMLRNFTNISVWLEKPELLEIKLASSNITKSTAKLYDFTMAVLIKRDKKTLPTTVTGAVTAPNIAQHPNNTIAVPTQTPPVSSPQSAPNNHTGAVGNSHGIPDSNAHIIKKH